MVNALRIWLMSPLGAPKLVPRRSFKQLIYMFVLMFLKNGAAPLNGLPKPFAGIDGDALQRLTGSSP
ncbi:MAG: hypothetical protein J2P54_06060 [Bradyrhizobiaceae bacterium]|nr:hypothetical protein [Bradyrhizobiaceae bacterium]